MYNSERSKEIWNVINDVMRKINTKFVWHDFYLSPFNCVVDQDCVGC